MKKIAVIILVALGWLGASVPFGCLQPEPTEKPVASSEPAGRQGRDRVASLPVGRQGKKPSSLSTPAEVSPLIAQLGDDNYFVRESASKELEEIGEPALEAIKRALKESKDAEVRLRARELVQDIEWTQRIKNLPRTFGEQYYKWIQDGKKAGYARLTIKEAEYQGQPVFKLQSKGVLPCLSGGSMKIEMTTYAQRDRHLKLLYSEAKGTGSIGFEFKVEVKDGKGHLTGQVKMGNMEIPVDKIIKVPEDAISWEGLIIGATALPMRKGLSFRYSAFGLVGFEIERLNTQPLQFVGEEEINLEGKKIRCYKFMTEMRRSNISRSGNTNFWIDKDRRLIKVAGEHNEFILTDKEDALKMPESEEKEKD